MGHIILTHTGDEAFFNTAYYNNDNNWPDGVLYIGNHLIVAKSDIVKSDYVMRQGTKCIANRAFESCTGLTSITISDSVTNIGYGVFDGCKIKELIIADGSKTVTSTMVVCKDTLEKIIIPDSVTSIEDSAFNNTAYYKNDDNWSDGVLYIGNHLIVAKSDIVKSDYVMRQGTKCIANGAFEFCTGLTSVTIPDSVTSIGDSAFRDCTNLTNINIPHGVTSVGDRVFQGCTSLTNMIIPDSVTSVGDNAFSCCTNLTNITIPSSVTSISDNAFFRCNNLVITTFEGSFAHKYAVENNIKFKLIETVTGDPNGDGVIGLDDAILAARTDVGNTQISDGQIMSADVNGDGKVTVHDALLIVRFALGIIDRFPKVK